jgi:hypothetical protein
MSFKYALDKRTPEEARKHYDKGNAACIECAKRLSKYTDVVMLNRNDKFGQTGAYGPDFKMVIRGIWYKIEFKYTERDLTWVQWKRNQWEAALKETPNIKLMQVCGNKFCLIEPTEIHKEFEKTYCNKPTVSFKPKKWMYTFESIFL